MSQFKSFFIVVLLLFYFEKESVFAQGGAAGAVNLAAHGVLALMGGNHKAKQEKIIEQSTKQEKINGSNVTVTTH